jgi:FMN phosphatase YigB (HAD superfamily)
VNSGVATRAILFDLGNTLVGYDTSTGFPLVLRRCLRECARALGQSEDPARDEDLFERALLLNREQSDYAVRPLAPRLQELSGAYRLLDEASAKALGEAFLEPIFATARLDPQTVPLLEALRGRYTLPAMRLRVPAIHPEVVNEAREHPAWSSAVTRHGIRHGASLTPR